MRIAARLAATAGLFSALLVGTPQGQRIVYESTVEVRKADAPTARLVTPAPVKEAPQAPKGWDSILTNLFVRRRKEEEDDGFFGLGRWRRPTKRHNRRATRAALNNWTSRY